MIYTGNGDIETTKMQIKAYSYVTEP